MGGVEVAERPAAEILRAAKHRISDPDRWTQCAFARTGGDGGNPIGPSSGSADCWCARGAIYAEVAPSAPSSPLAREAEGFLRDAAPPPPHDEAEPIAYLNDEGTHDEVLDLFDRAIALAGAEQT